MPITAAARSKAWTLFARLNTGFVGSNPTQGMDVCVLLFYVCVVLYVGSGLETGWFPVQGISQTVYRIKKLKKRPKSKGLYSRKEREIIEIHFASVQAQRNLIWYSGYENNNCRHNSQSIWETYRYELIFY
jgi:hypothetical protein